MTASRSPEELSAWLVDWIANELSMPPGGIDTARSLLEYSLSSVTATILVGDLEDWLDLRLPPTLVWDFPSIDAMTEHLTAQLGSGAETGAPARADAADAAQLLDNLDAMSEAEIDALLQQFDAAEAR